MRIFEDVTFANPPVMLAAWPGMGNVGIYSTDYIRRALSAKPFAEIDMTPFFVPDAIVVKDGVAQFPELPSSMFYYTSDPAMIFFESNAQISGRDGITIIKTILDVVTRFNVQAIYTSAAFAQSMSYQDPSEVLYACNEQELFARLSALGISPMPDGFIAGLNGLMLGVAGMRNIAAACFLGTIPTYATSIAYPKASLEIVKLFSRLLPISIDLADMEQNVAEMDQQMATIEERIRQFFPSQQQEQDEEMAHITEEKVPHYIMEKIEKLFKEAAKDRAKAPELKKELDRWNLYELYENRFLDLFEDDKKKHE